MRRLLLALRAFFSILFSAQAARQIEQILSGQGAAAAMAVRQAPPPKPKPPPAPSAPVRSDALNLLAALQREARFVDFVKERLDGYTDAQVGAVARQVHRDCGLVLERLFALKAVLEDREGAEVELPEGFDAGRYRLTGNVTGRPPFRGRLVHHGWEAAACDLPAWSGTVAAVGVVAPAEVELPQAG